MNRILRFSSKFVAWACMIVMLLIAVPKGHAQSSSTLFTEGFNEEGGPSNWTNDNTGEDGSYWSSAGFNGNNGSWVFDNWDCGYDYLQTPEIDLSGYTDAGDSVTIEFDLYMEYNAFDASTAEENGGGEAGAGGSQFQLQYDNGTSDEESPDILLDLTPASSFYTYNSGSSEQISDPDTSPDNWRHYKITVPVEARYSTFRAVFFSEAYENCNSGNVAVDNVLITASKASSSATSYSPTSLDFGSIAKGVTTASKCVTVNNLGSSSITINSVILAGTNNSDFAITPTAPTVINGNSSADFCITFDPTAGGARTASLVINNTSGDNPQITIPLSGIGLLPIMKLIPVGAHNTTTKMFQQTLTKLDDTLEQMVIVKNIGNDILHVFGQTNISGTWMDQYLISHLPPPSGIAPGDSSVIKIKYIPTIEGLHQATLNIINDGVDGTQHITLDGVGVIPKIVISPSIVRFDSTAIGDTVCTTILVENPGSDTLRIKNQVSTSDGDFIITRLNSELTVIPPGKSVGLNVCFAPRQAGTRQTSLVLMTNIPLTFDDIRRDTATVSITITGTGVPYGSLAFISGQSGISSAIIGTQICRVDTIFNTGDADVRVSSFVISGPDMADFSITGVRLPFVLKAHSKIAITSCVTPSQRGVRQALLTVTGTSNDTLTTASISLLANGLAVCAEASPAEGLFTNMTVVKSTDSVLCVLVTNCGDVPAVYTTRLTDTSNYSVTPSQSALIGPGDSVKFCVTFAPSATGELDSKLIISSTNVADMPINLRGIGGCSILSTELFTVPTTNAGGHSTFQITLNNTGNFDYTLGTPLLMQSGTAYRIVAPAPTAIPAGGNVQITIGYDPTDISMTYSGELTFPNGGPCAESAIKADFTSTTGTADVRSEQTQNGFELGQNYPNPASHTTSFDFVMPKEGAVSVTLSDLTGKRIQTLIDGNLNQGLHSVKFDVSSLSAGTYIYTLETKGVKLSRTMILQK